MKKTITILALFIGLFSASAQITWEKKLNVHHNGQIAPGFSSGILETPDKGFIVTGNGTTTDNKKIGYIYKLNKNGDSVWKKTYEMLFLERISNVFFNNNNQLMVAMEVLIPNKKHNIVFARLDESTGDTSNSFIAAKPNNADGYKYVSHVEMADGSYIVLATDISTTYEGASHLFRFMPGTSTHIWNADSLAYRVWKFYDMYLDNGSLILTGNGGTGSLRHNGIVVKYGLDGKPRWNAPFTHGGEWTTTYMNGSVKAADGNYISVGDKLEIVGGVYQNTPAVGLISPTGDTLKYTTHSNKIPGTINKIIKSGNSYYAIGSGSVTEKDPDGKNQGLRSMTLYKVMEDGSFDLIGSYNSGFQPATTGGGWMSTETSGLKLITASDGDLVLLGSGAMARADKTTYSVPLIIKMKAPTGGVGITEEKDINQLSVYPNPAYNKLQINASGLKNGTLIIMDITGRAVLAQQFKASEIINIDVKHFSTGTYMVQIADGSTVKTAKFIKAE